MKQCPAIAQPQPESLMYEWLRAVTIVVHFASFLTAGDQRSRPIESIVAEAQQLADEGVQEIVLISQITTNYGVDLYGKPQLAELLRALGEVDIPWIRMHYAYPTGLTPEVIAAIRETPNVCLI
jgi:tRNA A37 methylthiotransferase MiaB